MYTIEDFKNGLRTLFAEYDFEENKEKNNISFYKNLYEIDEIEENNDEENRICFELELSEVENILSGLSPDSKFADNCLYTSNSIETIVEYQGHARILLFRDSRDKYCASSQGCTITIGNASPQFIVAYICACSNVLNKKLRFRYYYKVRTKGFKEFCHSLRLLTCILTSANIDNIGVKQRSIFQSYLFNLSYNYDTILALPDDIDSDRLIRRRVHREGQLFPFKTYNMELVKYYNQGLSSDVPLTQYLAYYHVAEYFFQSISEHDVFQEIESYITSPSFSPHNKNSIQGFYKKIKKKIQSQKENDVWDERNGLLLCLKQFIPDISRIEHAISSIDSSAISYYNSSDVSFADEGKRINFMAPVEEVYSTIRNRVYSVRNAIVHSKEGEKLRYEPFKHDKELAKEIPLIRAIAEEIIINSAKPLKFENS